MSIRALAALEARAVLEEFSYQPSPLDPYDVDIRITHCGVCHTDLHLVDNDWGISRFPLVPGHEIVGFVTEAGSEVQGVAPGQRVGVGWQRSACLHCDYCLNGHENHCERAQATCLGNFGGFAERIRCDSRFVFPLPDSLLSEHAAPLLCAGITVYSPLRQLGVRSAMRVGVAGIGGLGHLAVQFAHAMGCEVTALSSSADKERHAADLGASHFVYTKDAATMRRLAGSLDIILSTAAAPIEISNALSLLKKGGTLCLLAAAGKSLELPVLQLMAGSKSIVGSATGGRSMIREMLQFAARHQVHAMSEVMPMRDANSGVKRVRQGGARFRVVLAN
jgi:alcohol/geraniol dehydrogenase (NADP+)